MNENKSDLVVELVNLFYEEILKIDPGFDKAFFRFYCDENKSSACASYTNNSRKAELIDTIKNRPLFDAMDGKFERLVEVTKKDVKHNDFYLILLTITSSAEYEIKFEYADPERWRITKMNGGTGLPE